MGKVNVVVKQYMSNNKKFADLCNYYLFDGKQVITAEELSEKDVTELALPEHLGEITAVEKVRDILKNCCIKTAKGVTYLLIGIENQSEIHYAMVVRNMLYDALNYSAQVSAYAKRHKKHRDVRGREFLSGFSREDRLLPVVTLTVYWNSGAWDGARRLHEMFEVEQKEILQFVPDYKLNLIVPDEIKDFGKFRTELGLVLEFFSCADSGAELKSLLIEKKENGFYLSEEAVKLINTCLHTKLEVGVGKGEEKDMCKAIEELVAEGRAEGKAEGVLNVLIQLVKDGLLDMSTAAERAGMRKEEFKKFLVEGETVSEREIVMKP